MKVKIYKSVEQIEELDIEYPVYLYFQDEDCLDEVIAILNDKCQITVRQTMFGVNIEKTSNFYLRDYYMQHQTTKEMFDEYYKEAINYLNEKLNNI